MERSKWSALRPVLWGFISLVVLVGGLGTWSVTTILSGAVIVSGQVEVALSRQIVQHPNGGVVEKIFVEEGDIVVAGDVLFRLEGSELKSELSIVENQLLELDARHARLSALSNELSAVVFPNALTVLAEKRPDIGEIVAGQTSLFLKQSATLAQAKLQRGKQIDQLKIQIAGLEEQASAIGIQIELLRFDLRTQKELLKKGLTQSARVLTLERELAEFRGRMGEVTSNRAQAAAQVTEVEIEITSLSMLQREKAEAELREIAARQLELMERRTSLKTRVAKLEIRAPASGIVLGLTVTTPRSVIRPAEPMMYIVPQDRPLMVEARLPVSHVDEVHPGQEVHLIFSALPSRTTPDIFGRVTLVSADALADDRSGAKYYRIGISIDAPDLQRRVGVEIMPGMPVEAYIRTADRTPLSYLVKPFADYFRMAFKES